MRLVNAKEIDDLLQTVSHRPWVLPKGQWSYYQEWNNALFLHWKVPTDELTRLIPKALILDTFNGESWLSLVAFTMARIKPRNFPSISMVSDFNEINIRTYVRSDNKSGVYFLSIEAEKYLSCIIAKLLSGLPYTKSLISFQTNDINRSYFSTNTKKDFRFSTNFTIGESITNKSDLYTWLTERYCLYLDQEQRVFRYETHHKPWDLHTVTISKTETNYKIGNISLE